MTGFGRATVEYRMNKITAEVKSLNSKQLDLQMREPPYYRELEPAMRSILADALRRGKTDLSIVVENCSGDAPVSLNIPVMRTYKEEISNMCRELGIAEPTDWVAQLMRMPEALHSETRAIDEEEKNAVLEATRLAAEALNSFREREGNKLDAFFREKIERIAELLGQVEPFEKERVAKLREKLEQQLDKLTGVEVDAGRLEQEMIYYIEKLDVTEEKTRLRAHLNYFIETMDGEPGQGKKLGFIAQEMGREINTLGSKSNNADMQRIVVRMKDELEQIKEQVLNVL